MSRLEVEVKLRVDCDGLRDLLGRLSTLGRLGGPVLERDVYYSHPCRDFSASDEAVRVRYVNGSPCCLTYKGPRQASSFKSRTEINVGVSGDPEVLLRALGFTRFVEVIKRRYYVDLEKAEVALDEVEGLGCFVEVEAKDSDERSVAEVLSSLGLGGEVVKETYAEMAVRRIGR
ncbi:MAG: class IV adenylate cyclase [Acidilobus sp.]